MDENEVAEPITVRRFLFLLVLIPVIFIPLHVATYQPLEHGSTAIFPSNASRPAGSEGLQYRDGETETFAFSIRNTGPTGVTIVDFPILHGKDVHTLFRVTRAEVSDTPGTVGPFEAFSSFALPSDQQRLVRVTGRFTECEWFAAGTAESFHSITVRYRYFGVPHSVDIPLNFTVSVESPPDAGCPRPRRS